MVLDARNNYNGGGIGIMRGTGLFSEYPLGYCNSEFSFERDRCNENDGVMQDNFYGCALRYANSLLFKYYFEKNGIAP